MKSANLNAMQATDKRITVGIFGISLLLRWILIFRGGQYYFPDEVRYENSVAVAALILHRNFLEALSVLTAGIEHIGYRAIAILPALIGKIVDPTPIIPALFFSLFSVFNLYLIWRLARQVGASSREATFALLIAASSQSLLYYSRHLVPYDTSLSFALAALLIALQKQPTIRMLFACGCLSFLSFITYNGYWPLAGFAMIVSILHNGVGVRWFLRNVVWTCLGFVLPLGMLFLAMSLSGNNPFRDFRNFAGSVNQGDYSEGWSLPFEYLWQAEHVIILVLGLLSLLALRAIFDSDSNHIRMWAYGTVFVYLCLLIPSVYLHRFVVYGRLARQLMPFIILLAAGGMADIQKRNRIGHTTVTILLFMMMVQATWNFSVSFSVDFPREFVKEASGHFPAFRFSQKRLNTGAPSACKSKDYVMVNAKYIFPAPEPVPLIQGKLLISSPHPINFHPYQYEGYTPQQRQQFRDEMIRMEFFSVSKETQTRMGQVWSSIKSCTVSQP